VSHDKEFLTYTERQQHFAELYFIYNYTLFILAIFKDGKERKIHAGKQIMQNCEYRFHCNTAFGYVKSFTLCNAYFGRSQWPRGLRRRSTAARLLRLWFRNPMGAWMSVVCIVCCQIEVSAKADRSSRGVLSTVVRRCV